MKAKLLITTTALIGAAVLMAAPAKAQNVTWSFGNGTGGNLGTTTTQLPDPGSANTTLGIPLTAFGGGDLFRKELGGDETGIGLTNDPSGEDEITGTNFIQISTTNLTIPPLTSLSLSFGMDSVTAPDAWQVLGTNTAGSDTGVLLLSGADEGTHTLNPGGFAFLDVSATAGNVLLREMNATVGVPEPLSLSVLGIGGRADA